MSGILKFYINMYNTIMQLIDYKSQLLLPYCIHFLWW